VGKGERRLPLILIFTRFAAAAVAAVRGRKIDDVEVSSRFTHQHSFSARKRETIANDRRVIGIDESSSEILRRRRRERRLNDETDARYLHIIARRNRKPR